VIGFVTAKEFAKLLEISERQLGRMVDAGQIPQPLPRVQGGKRLWKEKTVHEVMNGGEAA